MQARPFIGVQEDQTITNYAKSWSNLVAFCIRLFQDDDESNLKDRILPSSSPILPLVSDVIEAADELHAVNTDGLELGECIHAKSRDTDSSDPATLRLHAKELARVVSQLTSALVRSHMEQDSFEHAVIAYTAIMVLRKDGAWVSAENFTPFLSKMIHCMQLGLLGYCLQHHGNQEPPCSLESFIKDECVRFLVNTSPSPIGELSFWRLLCSRARNDSQRHPVTTISPDCMQVSHANIELDMTAWRQALKQMLQTASSILADELLFGEPDAPFILLATLKEDASNLTPGYSFINNPRNNLKAHTGWLFARLQAVPSIRSRFFKGDSTACRQSAGAQYHAANQRFLRCLAMLIYMTTGLPPRRKELIGISWVNQESARNIYLYNGLIAIVTSYHKSQWKVGSRPIARFLPPTLGQLLLQYLILIPPFLRMLEHCMQQGSSRGFLFCEGDIVWSPDHLTRAVQGGCMKTLGFEIGPRQWRHMAIALDRRLLQGAACSLYGISETWGQQATDGSDSEADFAGTQPSGPNVGGDGHQVHHMQAAHTSLTNSTVYGNSAHAFPRMTDTLLANFCDVSQQWFQVAHMQSPNLISRPKRPVESIEGHHSLAKRPSTGSLAVVRRSLWERPTFEALNQGLRRLFGPDAQPRSLQRQALNLIACSEPETLIVMPTGAGKTALYVIPTLLPQAQVTVVIIPLIALKHDLIRRCQAWQIPHWVFNPLHAEAIGLHAVPQLVLVDVERAVQAPFLSFLKALNREQRLDRIVLEEAHLVLTASHYREHLGMLGVIRQVQCPFVCLTGTLPPTAEYDLQQSLYLSAFLKRLRASSDRPYIEYCVQRLQYPQSAPEFRPSREELLIQATITICRKDLQHWNVTAQGKTITARSICYVRTVSLAERLAKGLNCHCYHGSLTEIERQELLTAWHEGSCSPIMVATAAFAQGVDYPEIRHVIHVDAPNGLLDYAQETGRAGRDGLLAVCTVLLPPSWKVQWNNQYRSDFLAHDCDEMEAFLKSKGCLRRHLTAYLDGFLNERLGIACSDVDDISSDRAFCSNCQASSAQLEYDIPSETTALDINRPAQHSRASSPACSSVSSSESSKFGSSISIGDTAIIQHMESSIQEKPRLEKAVVWDIAAKQVERENMTKAELFDCYQERLATWGRACMLCSLHRHRNISFPHPDCMQTEKAASMDHIRHGIRFDRGAACFWCGQPEPICNRRSKSGTCKYPWVIWHSCWVLLWQDRVEGARIVRLLGGPELSVEQPTAYIQWLGQKVTAFTNITTVNAVVLVSFWLDRLEQLVKQHSLSN